VTEGAAGPTIWVDADACPGEVREIILRAAKRVRVRAVFVANRDLVLRSEYATSVRVKKGADVADDHIASSSAPGDLAVTADIPLAALLVKKGVVAIDPRGGLYDEENIGERLSTRDLLHELRDLGVVVTGGPSRFDPRAKQRFAATLDSQLTRALRRIRPPRREE
jgi:uncharacterized protein YaiI (UPF0178 family)